MEPLPGLKPVGLLAETIDLGEILAPLLAAAGAIADDREIQLVSYLPEYCPAIRGDASSLREVISNVLDNALKYTPTGGAVEVRWQRGTDCSGWQWLIVSDTGPGIPPQDLPHLFERHYRGVQESGNIPGTGLGLALAWDWMERMGGRLEVNQSGGNLATGFDLENGGHGGGVSFVVTRNSPQSLDQSLDQKIPRSKNPPQLGRSFHFHPGARWVGRAIVTVQ